ncbi:MAG: flavodoxin family protein [Armatimonadota bacterium]|nr:flavodoxin family protein [Armatimonadota bacterium]
MGTDLTRRKLLGMAGTAVAAGAAPPLYAARGNGVKIIGISCSPRPGKTTAASLRVALDAAKAAGPGVEVELIELAGLRMDNEMTTGIPAEAGQRDDFPQVAAKLSDPRVAGIIVGTPVYFGNMSALCKTFLDRCMLFRSNNFALSNKVGGVLAVGGVRNGGQETTILSVLTALLSQEMVVVGDGRPTAHIGATVWNDGKNDVTQDEFGMSTARNLGRRVAEVALRMAAAAK